MQKYINVNNFLNFTRNILKKQNTKNKRLTNLKTNLEKEKKKEEESSIK